MTQPLAVVASDKTAAWRFGRYATTIVAAATAAGVACAFVADPSSGKLIQGILLGIIPLGFTAGYGYAWYACWRFGDVSYEVGDGVFRVRRGDAYVREIPLKAISYFKMRHIVDRKSLIIRLYPPMWPRGVVTYEGPRGRKTVELTPVLLWGEDEFSNADAHIRGAIFGDV